MCLMLLFALSILHITLILSKEVLVWVSEHRVNYATKRSGFNATFSILNK